VRTVAAEPSYRQIRVCRPVPEVLELTIARGARHNALNRETLDELAAALRDARARCAILRGEGTSFSAGYDLKEAIAVPPEKGAERFVVPVRHEVFDLLAAGPFPVLATLQGTVAGGGLELAMACDMRIAAPDTRLSVPAGRLGLVYSHTGVQRILDVCGPAVTRELFLFGRTVDAERAARLGIVAEVVGPVKLLTRAREIAAGLLGRAAAATAANKRIIATLRRSAAALDRGMEGELVALRADGIGSAEFERGLRAFAAGERAGTVG
jgi:enoyl-CoA hydratase